MGTVLQVQRMVIQIQIHLTLTKPIPLRQNALFLPIIHPRSELIHRRPYLYFYRIISMKRIQERTGMIVVSGSSHDASLGITL